VLLEALEGRTLLSAVATVVKDIDPRVQGFPIVDVAATSGRAFFVIQNDGAYELWSTDGTDAGTAKLTTYRLQPNALTAIGGILYFGAVDNSRPSLPRELWRSDGTAAGTYALTADRSGLHCTFTRSGGL
jgi:ELWxxDGT repeat protein